MGKGWIGKAGWALAALAIAAVLVWAFLPSPVDVELATVTRGAFSKTIDEDGKTRVRERYVVSAPLAGQLLRVDLKPGASVGEGTLLATLVPSAPRLFDVRTERELAERVGAAEAEEERAGAAVERARVAIEQANADLARAAKLAGQGFTSKETLERAERGVELKAKELKLAQFEKEVAKHQAALARAAQSRGRQDSGVGGAGQRWQLRSPVAGQVLRVIQESEAAVPMGAPLIEIGDPHDLEVVVDVLTADAAAIRVGAEAELDHGGNALSLTGRVRLIEPAAFTKVSALGVEEQRVNVVIDFAAPLDWQNLGDAHRVDARIVVEKRSDAVMVPLGALFRHDGGWAAFVVADGRARMRVLRLGPRNAQDAVVEEGLERGERVIVFPPDAVRDGVRVRARESQRR
ncbi:MAG TPA: HlyD family efflux transporter periplasmic adaptor subunit [Casimicrobiaceae bacterium]